MSQQHQVLVKVYKGKRQSDAAKDFQKEASSLAAHDYMPVSQSWAEGRSGCMRVILLGFIGALIWKPAGTLSVTYALQRPIPPQIPYPYQPPAQMPAAQPPYQPPAQVPAVQPYPQPLEAPPALPALPPEHPHETSTDRQT